MRFAIPPTQDKARIVALTPKEWPIYLRLAVIFSLFAIGVTLAALWVGYKAISPGLHDSLRAAHLFEANTQADRIEHALKQLRNGLQDISELSEINEYILRDSLSVFFHENTRLIQEIGFKDAQQKGFLLLRDKKGFTRLSAAEAAHGLYSPFQQLNTLNLKPGQAALYPPVYFDDPAQVSQSQTTRAPVMRMALVLPDQSGTLVLGIGLADLCAMMDHPLKPGSIEGQNPQAGSLRLSFYFDTRGWILFENNNTSQKQFLPDLSREGYQGDLGRPGYDAAFRPWAQHEGFWAMVTEVQAGKSGSVSAPANKYLAGNVGASGFLSFAPVSFSPSDDAAPIILGGIAYFENSTLPLNAFLRLANYAIVLLVAVILLSIVLAFRVNKKLAKPMSRMTRELMKMTDSGQLSFINADPAAMEQHHFQSAVNGLIAGAMHTKNQLEALRDEIAHARSNLPVNLRKDESRLPAQVEAELGLVGSGTRIHEVREHVRKAAKAGTDVLLWGETGTGKELVAAAIHKAGSRHDGPYISINCGALDENLLLDALFGHVKGAFSEAKTDRKGAFLAAHGGTLHLDEIGNASPKVQQALLRALSVRRIRPLGSDEEVSFDTRVVAATNEDLRERVREGTFREDLFYRLAIISIAMPPLRMRKEDIPELAAHCIHDAAISLGRPEAQLSRGALDLMFAHNWPGNVRELKNCLTRAMAFVEGDVILSQHITLEQDGGHRQHGSLRSLPGTGAFVPARDMSVGPFPTGAPSIKGDRPPAGRAKEGASDRPPTHVDVATGPAKVVEHLFPSPPRENFTGLRGASGNGPVDETRQSNSEAPPQGGRTASRIDTYEEAPMSYVWQGLPVHSIPFSPPFPTPGGSGPSGLWPTVPPARTQAAGKGPELPPQTRPDDHTMPPQAGRRADESRLNQMGLNERQQCALEFARRHGSISRPQLEEVAGADVSSRTLQNDLRELVERGILKRVGAGPATYYELDNVS